MKIYLDINYRCHVNSIFNSCEIETDFFNGRCKTFIEGYRFIPTGKTWIDKNGFVFNGEMVVPAEDYSRLQKAQLQYEFDEVKRLSNLNIPQEQDFIATQNYSIGDFLSVYGDIYEVIQTIPMYTSINNNNTILTTVEHYLDTLKEEN